MKTYPSRPRPHYGEEAPPRHATHRRRVYRRRRILVGTAAALVVLLGGGGIAIAALYHDVNSGISRSDFSLPQVKEADDANPVPKGEQNILIMGLDSRRDQQGNALPEEVYTALRAGDENDGGYNANVLMLVHIPADGGQAVGISIPRDDYVELVGAPSGVAYSKIKEAYGLAFAERMSELVNAGELSNEDAYQEARAAGRQSQIETVSHFLGDVRIDHFIEMTMAGFYSIANAVAPITVCLNQATEDAYSGANFVAGIQELDPAQAMSFVRQRRDTGYDNGVDLTDFDRTRRQQAFMVALANKLKDKGTLTNVGTLKQLIDTAKQYLAMDTEFDLLSFGSVAAELAGGNLTFVTLPIVEFGMIDGKSVNIVDVDEVQAMVRSLLGGTTEADDADDAPADDGLLAAPQESTYTGEDAGAEVPAEPELPADGQPQADGTATYSTWDEPLHSGSLPCVN